MTETSAPVVLGTLLTSMTLEELQKATGIDATRWSGWFNGLRMSELSVDRAARGLTESGYEATAGEVLDAVRLVRRTKTPRRKLPA